MLTPTHTSHADPWAKYSAIPFEDHGRSYCGCDCWGLVALILCYEFGIRVPLYNDGYNTTEDSREIEALMNDCSSSYDKVPIGSEEPGDIVRLRMDGRKFHVGLIKRRGIFIHTRIGHGVTIGKCRSKIWKHRIAGIYRVRCQEP